MDDFYKCIICNTTHKSGEKCYLIKDTNGIYQPTCSKDCFMKAKDKYIDILKKEIEEI